MQEPEALAHRLLDELIDACHVAARSGEAANKAKLNRVLTDGEDDRNYRCCSFGRQRGHPTGRSDHGDLSANQIGHQRWQTIVLGLQLVVLHRPILAFYVAGFVEAFTKRGYIARVCLGRSVSDKSDHRHRRLLRARRKWPSGCRTAEKPDELASLHVPPENTPSARLKA